MRALLSFYSARVQSSNISNVPSVLQSIIFGLDTIIVKSHAILVTKTKILIVTPAVGLSKQHLSTSWYTSFLQTMAVDNVGLYKS
jgi:hypothetical protein